MAAITGAFTGSVSEAFLISGGRWTTTGRASTHAEFTWALPALQCSSTPGWGWQMPRGESRCEGRKRLRPEHCLSRAEEAITGACSGSTPKAAWTTVCGQTTTPHTLSQTESPHRALLL